MKRLAIISALFTFTIVLFAQGFQQDSDQVDTTPFDTLHLYPSKYQIQPIGIPLNNPGMYAGFPITTDILSPYGLDTLYEAVRYTVPQKFVFDANQNYLGYVMCCETEEVEFSYLVLLVMSEEDELIFSYKVAHYLYLESAFEETKNSWLFDEDNDGDLDLAYKIDLIDYEPPNEFADNISGTTTGFLRFDRGKYTSEYLEDEQFQLKLVK